MRLRHTTKWNFRGAELVVPMEVTATVTEGVVLLVKVAVEIVAVLIVPTAAVLIVGAVIVIKVCLIYFQQFSFYILYALVTALSKQLLHTVSPQNAY